MEELINSFGRAAMRADRRIVAVIVRVLCRRCLCSDCLGVEERGVSRWKKSATQRREILSSGGPS